MRCHAVTCPHFFNDSLYSYLKCFQLGGEKSSSVIWWGKKQAKNQKGMKYDIFKKEVTTEAAHTTDPNTSLLIIQI